MVALFLWEVCSFTVMEPAPVLIIRRIAFIVLLLAFGSSTADVRAQLIRVEASNTPSYYHYISDPWHLETALIYRKPPKDLRFTEESILDSASFVRLSSSLRASFPFCEYYTANEDGSRFDVNINKAPRTPLTTLYTYGRLSDDSFEPIVQLRIRFTVPEGHDPRLPLISSVEVITVVESMELFEYNDLLDGFSREREEQEQMPPAPPPPPPPPGWDIRKVLGCDQ
jgi:hypothetical protein